MKKRKKMVPSRGRSMAEVSVLDRQTEEQTEDGKCDWHGERRWAGGPRVAGEVHGGLPYWTL